VSQTVGLVQETQYLRSQVVAQQSSNRNNLSLPLAALALFDRSSFSTPYFSRQLYYYFSFSYFRN